MTSAPLSLRAGVPAVGVAADDFRRTPHGVCTSVLALPLVALGASVLLPLVALGIVGVEAMEAVVSRERAEEADAGTSVAAEGEAAAEDDEEESMPRLALSLPVVVAVGTAAAVGSGCAAITATPPSPLVSSLLAIVLSHVCSSAEIVVLAMRCRGR